MSDEILFDGVRYVSANNAADYSNLSRDYVARLCRTGKIRGRQIGTHWYVEKKSLSSFLLGQQYTKSERQGALAQQRLREYHGTSASDVSPVFVAKKDSGILIPALDASRTLVHRADPIARAHVHDVKKLFEQAFAKNGDRTFANVSRIGSAPAGFAHAALAHVPAGIHVPAHIITPLTEFVHKLTALALAVLLTFGTYAFVDPQYARYAADTVAADVQKVLGAYRASTGGGIGIAAQRAETQLAAAAENPAGTFVSLRDAFGNGFTNLARAVNSNIDELIYTIAFPEALVRSLASVDSSRARVSVSVGSFEPATTSVQNTTVQNTGPRTVINQPIVERIVETQRILSVGGITEDILNARLQELDNKLSSRMYGLTTANSSPQYAPAPVITLAQATRIDQLANVTITNATISGGSISGISLSAGSLSGVVAIVQGGTGTSTAPSYGQVLLGDGNGGYTLTATSSLGISGSSGASLSDANTWTALQLFSAGASTTALSAFDALYVGRTATTTIRGDGVASTLPYASSTAVTVSGTGYFGTASTTNLTVSSIASGSLLKTTTGGSVIAAIADTDYVTVSGLAAAFPFTPTTNFGAAANSTSTALWFQNGLQSSSTIQTTALNIWPATTSVLSYNGQTLLSASTTNFSTFLGIGAGTSTLTTGVSNSGFGYESLQANTTGDNNSAFGYGSLYKNTTGSNNTAIGYNALRVNTGGLLNTAIGSQALLSSTGGTSNVAIGYSALSQSLTGTQNTAIGVTALTNSTGDHNVALGYNAGRTVTSGYANILLGTHVSTADVVTTGNGNIGLGNELFFPSATANNQLNLGGLLFGTLPATSTAFRLPTSGTLGVGTSSPFAKFSIQSNDGDTTTTLFAIGSSTASATTTLFSVSNTGHTSLLSASSSLVSVYDALYVGRTATTTIRGDGVASIIPYASSTAITVSGQSYLTGGFLSLASSTIGDGTQTGGLTISGGATTTGNAVFSSQLFGADGAASAPTFSFGNNTNSGIYNNGGSVVLASAGTARLTIGSAITTGGTLSSTNSAGFSLLNTSAVSVTAPNIIVSRGDSTTGFAAGTSGNINAIVGGTERTRWTSTGFGIGTTSPWRALSVHGSSDLGVDALAGSFTATSTTATSTFAGGIAAQTSKFIVQQTSGRVGIGTLSPTTGLDVDVATDISGDLTLSGGGSLTVSAAGPINQTGTGQVTFAGNVDATAGLDVTNSNFTVGSSNFIVAPSTGNTTIAGTLSLSSLTGAFAASSTAQVTGASRFYSTLRADGLLTAAAAGTGLSVTNNAAIGGTLSLTGAGTFASTLDVTGALTAATTTLSGELALNTKKITGVATPSSASDAANKSYVDSVAQGLDLKDSVVAGTTGAITLSGEQTVDGVSLTTGNRVLVKNQTDTTQNGLYTVAVGSWSRSTDADTSAEVSSGLFVFIESGTTNANSGWVLTTADPITLGSSNLNFTQFSGAGQIVAGTGITKSGNTLDVGGTTNRITVNADSVDISSSYVGQSSITTVGELTSGSIGSGFGAINIGSSALTAGAATFSSIVGSAITGSGNLTVSGTGSFTGNVSITGELSVATTTLSGNLVMGGKKITGLADPTSAQEAATKAYVDAIAQGLTVKASVRVATTTNITLSGAQTIDGVSAIAGDRVLVMGQTTGSQNGIYVVAAGSWSRSSDANENSEVITGIYAFVEEGTANANTGWSLITPATITLDSTSLTFTQFSGSAEVTAGNGLTKTGNTINAVGTTDRITVSADAFDIASTYVGQSSLTTVGTLISGAIGSGFGAINIGSSALTAGTSIFSTATSYGTLSIGGTATTSIVGNSATSTFSGGVSLAGGNINLASGGFYLIDNARVLSATALGSGVVGSSLTSVGALDSGSLTTGFGAINIGGDSLQAGAGTLSSLTVSGQTSLGHASTTMLSNIGISYFGATATSSFSTAGVLTLAGSPNGPLQANAGVVSATTSVGILYGGTGTTTAPISQLLYGGASGVYQSVATSSLSLGASLTSSGTAGALVGGSGFTLSLNTANANSWTGLQQFANASTSLFSAYGPSYFGATATSTFTSTGALGIASSTPWGLLSINPDGISGPSFVVGSSTATSLIVTNAGRVGVGTTTPSTNFTFGVTGTGYFSGGLTADSLTLGSALGVVSGGTGTTTAPSGQLLYGGGAGVYQSVATSSLAVGSSLSTSGTLGYQIGGTNTTFSLNTGNANTWTALQQFANASSSLASSYQAWFGATATSSFSGAGVLTLAGSLNGPLQANAGVVSATTSIGVLYGGTGATTASGARTNLGAAASGANSDITSLSGLTTALSIAQGGTATTTFYSGGIVFSDGTKLTQSSAAANFYWDETNKRLGVGTSTPWAQFSINPDGITGPAFVIGSSTATYLTVSNGGYLGVGTTSPYRKLSITDAVSTAQASIAYDGTRYTEFLTNSVGDLVINPQGDDAFLNDDNFWVCTGGSCPSDNPTGTGNLVVENKLAIGTTTPAYKLTIETQDSSTNFLQVASSTAQSILVLNANGNLGLATSSPFAKFAVGPKGAIVTTENALTDGATIAINWLEGNQQRVTLGGNRTITFSNYIDGQILRLVLCQDATGSRTITWPSVVLWNGGTAPTLTTTANKCDLVTFVATQATSTLKVFGAAALAF